MKSYELNTRLLESASLRGYQDYFELVYYNNFCQGYKKLRSSWCSENITSSGMNVVIQYLMNDNRATIESMAISTNKKLTRKEELESSDLVTVGKKTLQ